MTTKSNYVFFGTGQFSAIILEKLIHANLKPALVVTAPDKPVGRHQILTPSPVKQIAQKHHLPVLTPEKLDKEFLTSPAKRDPALQDNIKLLTSDFFLLTAYGKLIPKEYLALPPQGALNIHPSLLPKYRGPSPIQEVILNGEKETGVTIILMDEEIDHGPILAQEKLAIEPDDTYETLAPKLAELGASLAIRNIEPYLNHLREEAKSSFVSSLFDPELVEGEFDDTESGKRPTLVKPKMYLPPLPQNHNQATYTKILTRQDGYFNVDNPPQNLKNMIRAFHPWPGVWTKVRSKNSEVRIKLLPKNLIQLEGKKPVSFEEFLRGCPKLKPQLERLRQFLG